MFYLTFIEGKRAGKKDVWLQNTQDNRYKIWRGYTFESICIKHVEAIKQALGISGVQTEVSGFRKVGNATEKGIQIDMLIDRNDRWINLCEMKFYTDDLMLNKEDADKLRRRRSRFQQISKTKKTVFNTIVTTYGLISNTYSYQVDSVVTMDALFLLESFE